MSNPDKTVFISYRRSVSRHLAWSIFQDLRNHGYDVFLDVNSIDSGAFDQIILRQIAARKHFIVLLSPGTLERCVNNDDWLRLEIEEAIRIQRNIVPIIDEGFDFEREIQYLPPDLQKQFKHYNALPLPHFYFEDGMNKLKARFLKSPEYEIEISPAPDTDKSEIRRRIDHTILELQTYTQQPIPPSQPSPSGLPSFHSLITWRIVPSATIQFTHADPYRTSTETRELQRDVLHIAETPVTNEQFLTFVQDADGFYSDKWWRFQSFQAHLKHMTRGVKERRFVIPDAALGDHPVVNLTWFEAVAFCRWLSDKTQLVINLPEYADWLHAVQGIDKRNYPWGNSFEASRCNCPENSLGSTTSVRQYPNGVSAYGIWDLVGNVQEWCLNARRASDYPEPEFVTAGGSWKLSYKPDGGLQYDLPDSQAKDVGFRVVLLQDQNKLSTIVQ